VVINTSSGVCLEGPIHERIVAPKAAKLEATLQEARASTIKPGGCPRRNGFYRRILRDRPQSPGPPNTALGVLLKDQGKLDEAAAAFEAGSSRSAPRMMPQGTNNLGNILYEQGRLKEAEASLSAGAGAQSEYGRCSQEPRPSSIVDSGRFADSFVSFRRHAELAYGGPDDSIRRGFEPPPPHKARHDKEQRD